MEISRTEAYSSLFSPIKVGRMQLQHRVVMAPLTRARAGDDHVPTSLMQQYYVQRASVPGTFIIAEGSLISPKARGFKNAPGIWSEDQVKAWRRITDAVHACKSYIYVQLWALGRAADPEDLLTPNDIVSASSVPLPTTEHVPRSLNLTEIEDYVTFYSTAALRAIKDAGFDGVEVHAANGYLIDQFLQDVSNYRDDEYGGSIEARGCFALKVIKQIVAAIGEEAVGVRFSPWSTFQGMRMKNPIPTFSHIIHEIRDLYPNLAYLHLVEPGVAAGIDICAPDGDSNDVFRGVWGSRPLLSAGGYNRERAMQTADEKGDLIVFGRYFISNPDLPLRLKENWPLTMYDRSTFFDTAAEGNGYTTYKTYKNDTINSD